jgi:hypothetical protein
LYRSTLMLFEEEKHGHALILAHVRLQILHRLLPLVQPLIRHLTCFK